MSLDSLDPQVFARMSGGFGGVEEVLAGIEQARRAELAPIKVNAVVQRGVNDHTVLDLVERFRGTGVIVRFIEYMDVGNRNHWTLGAGGAVEGAGGAHRRALAARRRSSPATAARWRERYAFADGQGEVGFISSVIAALLRRLLARAAVLRRRALHLPVRQRTARACAMRCAAARATTQLLELIRAVWTKRADRYSELRASLRQRRGDERKVEMFYIGG